MSPSETLAGILGMPVGVDDDQLGTVTGVVCDSFLQRIFGLEAARADGGRTFLPWVAASLRGESVCAVSELVLFDADEVSGYVERGARIVRDRSTLDHVVASSDGRLRLEVERRTVSREVDAGTAIM